MSGSNILQKRTRKFIGLHENKNKCDRMQNGPRGPNPLPKDGKKCILNEPLSYLNRKLPPINPFKLSKYKELGSSKSNLRHCSMQQELLETITICDVDENFFSIIDGRSIKPNDDIKFYMRNVRDIAMTHASNAYLIDQIINMKTNAQDEEIKFQEANEMFVISKSNFLSFICNLYDTAKMVDEQAQAINKKLLLQNNQYEEANFEYVRLRTAVLSIRSVYTNLSRFGLFLSRISPLWWREKYDEVYQAEMDLLKYPLFSSIHFPKVYSMMLDDDGLSSMIDDEVDVYYEPNLYFEDPDQMMDLFNYLENQCMNYLENETEMSTILSNVLRSQRYIQKRYDEEEYNLNEFIKYFDEFVLSTEERESDLKQIFFKVLHKEFKETIFSNDSRQLDMTLQWAHSMVFGEDTSDITSATQGLESLYFRLFKQLDLVDRRIVRAAEREMFEKDKREMTNAHKAQRDLREYSIMIKSLHRAYDPPKNLKVHK